MGKPAKRIRLQKSAPRASASAVTPIPLGKGITFRVQSSPTFGGVLLELSQPVQMLGFTPKEATELGEQLIEHGRYAQGGSKPKKTA